MNSVRNQSAEITLEWERVDNVITIRQVVRRTELHPWDELTRAQKKTHDIVHGNSLSVTLGKDYYRKVVYEDILNTIDVSIDEFMKIVSLMLL